MHLTGNSRPFFYSSIPARQVTQVVSINKKIHHGVKMTDKEKIVQLAKECSIIKQTTVQLLTTFSSFKVIQDTINITLVQHNPEIKEEIADYIESFLNRKNSPLMKEALTREVQETLKYLRQESPLSPEERRERFRLVVNNTKPKKQ